MSRLRSSPLAGLSLLLMGLVLGCQSGLTGGEALERFEFSEPQMGLPFRMILYAADRNRAEEAARAAFARIADLNHVFSDYETDSELNELSYRSGEGAAVRVSPDLWRVLVQSQELAQRTEGAFDITVGPYVGLWRKARREKKLPDPARLEAARSRVGFDKVELHRKSQAVLLRVPNMRLDLGGIAKGYALEAAMQVLRQHGIQRALVSGGGDMVAGDPPPGRAGWRIEIAPLDIPDPPPVRYVSLRRQALATSGDLFQHLEIEGVRYSHIVDPRTGIGLTDHSLVTVIAPDGTTADSLATAVSVLGPKQGMRLIEDTPGVEASVMRQPGARLEVLDSAGFAKHLWHPEN